MTERTTYKAYRCRLYPKPAQEAYFRRMFSCCRIVYNHFLEVRITAYEARKADDSVRIPSRFDLCRMLTAFKQTELDECGRPFLKDVDSTALVYEVQHLDDAFRRFFKRMKNGAADAGFPRFKGRGDRDSCTVAFKRKDFVQRNKIRFAKIGWVNASVWRELGGEPVSCTVSVDAAGRWWASIDCKDVPVDALPPSESTATIDLGEVSRSQGVWHANGDSRGNRESGVPNAMPPRQGSLPTGAPDGPDAVGAEDSPEAVEARRQRRRRRRAERKLARRETTADGRAASRRCREQREKVARLRAREADRMRTQEAQAVAALVRENGTIVVEPAPEGERRTPAEAEMLRRLKYKCDWAGRRLIEK